jgi:Zn-finger nucleic acid-binding protein
VKCPHCHETLAITERQGIEIDYCPHCRGVWLDRGELDKLIERAVSHASGRNGHDDERVYSHVTKPRPKHKPKRESFWQDLFDFD